MTLRYILHRFSIKKKKGKNVQSMWKSNADSLQTLSKYTCGVAVKEEKQPREVRYLILGIFL